MRVLIVSTYFAPEVAGNGPYVGAVAEYLVESGHEVAALTGFPHYPDWKSQQRRVPWRRTSWNGIDLMRRSHFVPRSPTVLSRAVYEASLLVGGVLSLLLIRRRPDVVLAFSPALADGITASIAAAWFRCPMAVVFQDLMGVGAVESGVQGGARVSQLVSAVEASVARRATAVGFVSEGFSEWLTQAGAGSLERIFNWSKLARPSRTRAETRAAYGWGSQTVCVHGGNLGEKQGLEVIVSAARLAPLTHFVMAGDGNQRRNLERMVGSAGLTNVQFLGQLKDEEYANVLCAADVLVLCQRSSVRRMSLPSKLVTYRATGVPIVAAVSIDSEAARELNDDPNARLVPPGDPRALLHAISELANTRRSVRLADGVTADVALAGYSALLRRTVQSDGARRSGPFSRAVARLGGRFS
jgi:colanic acid biosynthesis glycosyl transferase WcaI